jgi:hypothetical protein
MSKKNTNNSSKTTRLCEKQWLGMSERKKSKEKAHHQPATIRIELERMTCVTALRKKMRATV